MITIKRWGTTLFKGFAVVWFFVSGSMSQAVSLDKGNALKKLLKSYVAHVTDQKPNQETPVSRADQDGPIDFKEILKKQGKQVMQELLQEFFDDVVPQGKEELVQALLDKKQDKPVETDAAQQSPIGDTFAQQNTPLSAVAQSVYTPEHRVDEDTGDGDTETQTATDVVTPFVVNVAAFAEEDRFYVGPDATGSSLARIEVGSDGYVQWKNMIKEPVTINDANATTSPLKDQPLANLVLAGNAKLPLASIKAAEDATKPGDEVNVYLFKNADGSTILKNATEIKDAAGQTINQEIVSLRAGSNTIPYVFAAVPDGTPFVRKVKKQIENTAGNLIEAAVTAATTALHALDNSKFVGITGVNAESNKNKFKEYVQKFYTGDVTIRKGIYTSITKIIGNVINLQDSDLSIVNKIVKLVQADDAGIVTAVVALLGGDIVDIKTAFDNKNSEITKAITNSISTGVETAASKVADANAAIASLQVIFGYLIYVLTSDTNDLFSVGDYKPWYSLQASDHYSNVAIADGTNRGVVLLKQDKSAIKLDVVGENKINSGVKRATKIDLDASPGFDPTRQVAFFRYDATNPITRAVIDDAQKIVEGTGKNIVSMCWDEILQRLYIGLSDVARADDASRVVDRDGGVCSILMGRVREKIKGSTPDLTIPYVLELVPVVKNVHADLFEAGDSNYLFGFYQKNTNTDNFDANAHLLNVMHSSVGMPYLVGNMWVEKGDEDSRTHVCALPLVAGDPKDINVGFIAKKNDHKMILDGANFSIVLNDMKQASDYVKDTIFTGKASALGGATLDGTTLTKMLKELLVRVVGVTAASNVARSLKTTNVANATGATYKSKISDVVTKCLDVLARGKNNKDFLAYVLEPIKTNYTNNDEKEGKGAAIEAGLGYALARHFDAIRTMTYDKTFEFVRDVLKKVKNALDTKKTQQVAVKKLYDDDRVNGFIDEIIKIAAAVLAKIDPNDTKNGFEVQVENAFKDTSVTGMLVAGKPLVDYAASLLGITGSSITTAMNKSSTSQDSINRIQAAAKDANKATDINLANTPWKEIFGAYTSDDLANGAAIAIEVALGYAIGKIYDYLTNVTSTTGTGTPVVFTTNKDGDKKEEMTTWTDAYAKVGSDPQLLSFSEALEIQDLQVVGDTVYIAVAGSRSDTHDEAGIFSSTAIFDNTPKLRAWTPWKRVMGSIDAVGFFGLDVNSSNFWYITADNYDTAKVTAWGKGGDEGGLALIIDEAFRTSGGVLGTFNFGPGTQGFKEQKPGESTTLSLRYPQFSMFVITGKEQIALVEMGKISESIFAPTDTFAEATEDEANAVHILTSDDYVALKDIGDITCAEVSRLPLATDATKKYQGWLFVGGQNGVAVFAQTGDGSGWNTSKGQGLDQLKIGTQNSNFPDGDNWDFVKIVDSTGKSAFSDVRKIVSDQKKYLYVVTKNSLHRFDMTKDKAFEYNSSHKGAPVTIEKVGNTVGELFDLMVVKRNGTTTKLLLATSTGLYTSNEFADTGASSTTWTEIKNISSTGLGSAYVLDFLSTQTGDRLDVSGNADGNVYALAKKDTDLVVYRFNVQNGNVTLFTEPYQNNSAGTTKTDYFYKIGGITNGEFVFAGPKDFAPKTKQVLNSLDGFADRVPVVPTPDLFLPDAAGARDTFKEINFNASISSNTHLGKLVHDSASGAQYTYGEFGVRTSGGVKEGNTGTSE
ncbi:MAG: hypothetical protein V1855_00795 [bacterium]